MNKKSHIIFTKKMNIELPVGCRRGLYLGSILPDLLVHTYLRGHTWKASGEKVLTKLKALEELGILNVWTGIRFGMLLHYLEDFFTMAHSRYFQGNLVEHIRYEVRLSRYIRALFAGNYKLYDGDPDNTQVYSMEDLHERIVSLQKDYQKEIREAEDETLCFATDLEYMNMAVQTVVGYMIPVMNRKTNMYRRLETRVMIRMPQRYRFL